MPITDNLTLNEIIDTGRDFLPVVSTIDAGKRWVNSGYAFEPGVDFALNLGADLLLPFGVGGVWRGVATMPKIARTAKALDRTIKTGKRFADGAKEALAIRNTVKAKRLNKGVSAASKKAENLAIELEDLKDIKNVGFMNTAVVLPAGTYKLMARSIKKDSDKKNSVEKRTEPYLYNTFLKKEGGIMKLIPKHEEGSAVRQVLDAGSYMLPIYGTYKSWQDVYNEPTWSNLGLETLSTVGDAALIFGGAGMGFKAANAGAKAAKAAERANKFDQVVTKLVNNSRHYNSIATKIEKKAKAAPKISSSPFGDLFSAFRIDPAKELKAKSVRALEAAVKADESKAAAATARNALLKTLKKYRLASIGSTAVGTGVKTPKAVIGSLNLVEKRTKPYLYKTFTK